MEFLIPGLILVALMVYASTRIKREAAAAWEAESIDLADFSVNKPEGILHILNGDAQFLFEAYSREYGVEAAAKTRIARIEVKEFSGTSLRDKVKEIKGAARVTAERNEVIDGRSYKIVETETDGAALSYRIKHKIGEKDGKVFVFTTRSLVEADEAMDAKLDAMLESFALK